MLIIPVSEDKTSFQCGFIEVLAPLSTTPEFLLVEWVAAGLILGPTQTPQPSKYGGGPICMFNKHPSDSHVQVRVGDPVLIGFLTKGLKSGSLKLSQTPQPYGKVGGSTPVQKGLCVWWGEEKKNLGSQILPSFFSRLGQGEAACWGGCVQSQ